jgi:hypothetical protein
MSNNPADSWTSPQTVIAMIGLAIMGGTVAGVFLRGDAPTISQTVGGVIGIGGMIMGYYFNSAISSQRKDTTIANLTEPKP